MVMIPDDLIEQVRESADVVGIIGETVALKRTGSDWRGPCPFHQGKGRNFAVIPKRGFFYCYVCHEKGDVFSYFMKRFGMDYPTAVREVARRSGIVIPDQPARSGPDPHEPIYTALATAGDWFTRQLLEAREAQVARDYLASREIPPEVAAPAGLGYAPPGRALLDEMAKLGVDEPMLLRAGLAAKREDGSVVARFRGRLLFPIHDLRGRPVGFGGRLLGPGEPKYLNSPESEVFSKGRLLYNLHAAKQAIRREEGALVVEGYFDVLRLVLAGVEHVVAPLGTALTPDQAALLRRFAPSVTLLYDSDRAGLRATFRAGDELLRHGARVRVATLPEGEDPDTLVRRGGAAALDRTLREAIDLLERKLQLLERRGWLADVEHRRGALDRLLPTIRAAKDAITRELYLSLVAERLHVSRDVLEREVRVEEAAARPAPAAPRAPAPAAPRSGRRVPAAERDLLRVLLEAPEWIARARTEVPPDWFETPELREIFTALCAAGPGGVDAAFVASLSAGGQRAYDWLRGRAAQLGSPDPDRSYVETCRALEARPRFREYDALFERIPFLEAADAKAAAIADLKQLGVTLQQQYPEEWAKRFHRKQSGRRRQAPDTTGRPHAP